MTITNPPFIFQPFACEKGTIFYKEPFVQFNRWMSGFLLSFCSSGGYLSAKAEPFKWRHQAVEFPWFENLLQMKQYPVSRARAPSVRKHSLISPPCFASSAFPAGEGEPLAVDEGLAERIYGYSSIKAEANSVFNLGSFRMKQYPVSRARAPSVRRGFYPAVSLPSLRGKGD